MATTIFKCIFHMSLECLKPTILVVSLAKLAQPDLQQSLLSLATIAKLVDNQQTFSCTLFWPVASPSYTTTLVSCASCFSVLYSSYLASGLFVLSVFTLFSQKVPQDVPNTISILLWPQFNYDVYLKKGGGGERDTVRGVKGKYVYFLILGR
jgi:hypothetical protein